MERKDLNGNLIAHPTNLDFTVSNFHFFGKLTEHLSGNTEVKC